VVTEAKLTTANEQIYIYLDTPDGPVIQTTMAAYEEYYRELGYKILGKPVPGLPPPRIRRRIVPGPAAGDKKGGWGRKTPSPSLY